MNQSKLYAHKELFAVDTKRINEDTGSKGNVFPEELYGLLTQIMLYVNKMDEDYALCRGKEQDI